MDGLDDKVICDYCGNMENKNAETEWWHLYKDFYGEETCKDFCSTECLAEWAHLERKGKNV